MAQLENPIISINSLKKSFQLKTQKSEGSFAQKVRRTFFPNYTEVVAVNEISFQIQRGEMLAFIGPNGAGKSTTIKMLTGILYPTSGSAQVLGFTPWKERKKLSYRIGTVFGQKSQLWLHLAPRHTFDLLARAYELDESKYQKRKGELVERFGLARLLDSPVRKLSLGERMRCEIAASLLHEPEIIFLDEPTIGLDPVVKAAIRDLIREENARNGVTVFLTSHDASDIEQLCKRVMIVNQGKLVLDDRVSNVQRNYLKRKEIDLKLDIHYRGDLNIPGAEILKAKDYGVKLAVDPSLVPLEKVISEVLKLYSVQDITIQNPPMEEIIASIYKRAH